MKETIEQVKTWLVDILKQQPGIITASLTVVVPTAEGGTFPVLIDATFDAEKGIVIAEVHGCGAEVAPLLAGNEILVIDHDSLQVRIAEALGRIDDLKFSSTSDRMSIASDMYEQVLERSRDAGFDLDLEEIVEQIYCDHEVLERAAETNKGAL